MMYNRFQGKFKQIIGDDKMIELDGMKIYNLDEVAKLLHINKATVRAYIKKGMIEARKVGGRWMITDEALKKLFKGSE